MGDAQYVLIITHQFSRCHASFLGPFSCFGVESEQPKLFEKRNEKHVQVINSVYVLVVSSQN